MILFLVLTGIVFLALVIILCIGIIKYKNGYNRYYNESKPWFIGSIVVGVVIVILIICVSNIEKEIISSNDFLVSFQCSKIRVAEYSDTIIYPCEDSYTDSNGNRHSRMTTCTDTKRWSEPVSDVVYTQMRTNTSCGRHELRYTNADDLDVKLITLSNGLIVPADPPVMWNYSKRDLDRVVVKTKMNFTMNLRGKDRVWITDTINQRDYFKALEDLKYERYRVIERLGDWVITNNTYEKKEDKIQ